MVAQSVATTFLNIHFNKVINIMKRTKKNIPVFVVDLTNATTAEDVANAFNKAKSDANIDVIDYIFDVHVNIPVIEEKEEVKLPWYKRFWNWITRKK